METNPGSSHGRRDPCRATPRDGETPRPLQEDARGTPLVGLVRVLPERPPERQQSGGGSSRRRAQHGGGPPCSSSIIRSSGRSRHQPYHKSWSRRKRSVPCSGTSVSRGESSKLRAMLMKAWTNCQVSLSPNPATRCRSGTLRSFHGANTLRCSPDSAGFLVERRESDNKRIYRTHGDGTQTMVCAPPQGWI